MPRPRPWQGQTSETPRHTIALPRRITASPVSLLPSLPHRPARRGETNHAYPAACQAGVERDLRARFPALRPAEACPEVTLHLPASRFINQPDRHETNRILLLRIQSSGCRFARAASPGLALDGQGGRWEPRRREVNDGAGMSFRGHRGNCLHRSLRSFAASRFIPVSAFLRRCAPAPSFAALSPCPTTISHSSPLRAVPV